MPAHLTSIIPSSPPDLPLPTPVLVVEDEPLIRQRLARILEQLGYQPDMLCFAQTLAAARQLAAQRRHALALVDLGLPDGNGTTLIAALRAQDAAMGILVISAWSTEEAILQALRAGATGYLLKERDDLEVMLSIRSVLRGGAPIDPFIARRVMTEFQQQPAADVPAGTAAAANTGIGADASVGEDALSAREIGILQHVANGLSHRETAERLHISRHTVEAHIRNIYRKLSVNSRLRAISEARARGWMD
ncbi:Transcriptional regulatory protein DegU [uncultured Comamonas sp.]|nr:Transcriptional regulatory protein DegU [uncultured Comamonas sp.]